MSRVKFQAGLHFWLKGREYIILQRLAGGEFQVRDVITENLSTLKETTLIQSLFKDELEFESLKESQAGRDKKDYRAADFPQLSSELKQEAKRRENYVKAALDNNLETRTQAALAPIIEQVAQAIEDPKPPSAITLYRWLKSYEDSGQDIRALVPNYRKRGDYRPKIHPEVRRLRRGIEFEGLYYNSPDLVRLRSEFEKPDKRRKDGTRVREKATLKIDPTDISTLYVFDPLYDNFIPVPALAVEYTKGLTLWQHKVIKNLAATEYKKVDIVALALAKKKIQEIVEQEWLVTKRGKTRTSMARWKGIGREGFNTGYQTEQPSNLSAPLSGSQSEVSSASHQSHPMTGISDRGSAFHLHDIQENLPDSKPDRAAPIEATPLNSVENNLDCSTIVSSTQKPPLRSTIKKKTPQKASQIPRDTETVNSFEVWEPDLTGWEVSIGLPNYSNEVKPNAED